MELSSMATSKKHGNRGRSINTILTKKSKISLKNKNSLDIPGYNAPLPSSICSTVERFDTMDDFKGLMSDIGSFKQVRITQYFNISKILTHELDIFK